LRQLLNRESPSLKFLAYEVNLETGQIVDRLNHDSLVEKRTAQILWIILSHFSMSNKTAKEEKLVNFRDLPGGVAYGAAFAKRAIAPIAETFGDKPSRLIVAGKALGGIVRNYGDVSIEIPALPRIPLVYILWAKDEFEASANVLFQERSSDYLPTEDLAVLGELATNRLQDADRMIKH
jgi:hypothetical protein